MNATAPEKKFPSCFPPDFEEKILPHDLPDLKMEVFRVCLTGTICKDTFLSSYEDISLGRKPKPYNWEKKKKRPRDFSVSCNDTLEGALHPLKCLTDYHPEAFLVHGIASSELGPMQRTIDREPTYGDETHIDWWLYADSDPSPMFERVESLQTEDESLLVSV